VSLVRDCVVQNSVQPCKQVHFVSHSSGDFHTWYVVMVTANCLTCISITALSPTLCKPTQKQKTNQTKCKLYEIEAQHTLYYSMLVILCLQWLLMKWTLGNYLFYYFHRHTTTPCYVMHSFLWRVERSQIRLLYILLNRYQRLRNEYKNYACAWFTGMRIH